MAIKWHRYLKLIFLSGIFLGGSLLATFTAAQSDSAGPSAPLANNEKEVKTFTVSPRQRTSAILMPNAQTPVAPAPLDSQLKSGILKSLGGTGAAAASNDQNAQTPPTLEHLLLSARHPFFNERGLLTLALPYAAHPETSIKFKKDFPGSAAVKLNVEEGQTYLLDFAVRSWGGGTYLLETESGKQQFEDESAGKQHILVALKATSSGWTTVRLNREGEGFHLYYAEVTRVQ